MKHCSRCKKLGFGPKPESEFCKDKQTPDGLCRYCRKHKSQATRASFERRGEEARVAQLAATKKWIAADPARTKAWRKRINKNWRTKHPGRARASDRKKEIARLQRVPSWADMKKIQQAYEAAKVMAQITDEPWDVDHVIPLQGKLVSGLHVHTNLQILSRIEHQKKGGNRFEIEF